MPTLIDQSVQQLTPQVLGRLGMMTGEKPPALQNAVNAIFPLLLSAISRGAGTPEGAEQVLNAVAAVEPLGDPLDNLQGGEPTRDLLQRGATLAQSLFGGSTTAVAQAVSAAGGVSNSSAANLLAVLAPLLLATIGRQLSAAGLVGAEDRAAGLAQLLAGQTLAGPAEPPATVGPGEGPAPAAVPPAVVPPAVVPPAAPTPAPAASSPIERAATAAAAATVAPVAVTTRSVPKPTPAPAGERKTIAPPPEPPKRSAWRWLFPLLLIAIVAGLAWYFFRPQPAIAPSAPVAGTPPAPATATATALTAATEAAPAVAATEESTATVEANAIEPAAGAATEEAATAEVTLTAAAAPTTAPTQASVETSAIAAATPVEAAPAAQEAATEATTETATETAAGTAAETAPVLATPTPAAAAPIATPLPTAPLAPTAAAAPTTVPTAATTAAPVTFSGVNAAVCTAIAAAQATLNAVPPITAQTSGADVQSLLGEVRTAARALTDAVSGRSDINLSNVNNSVEVLGIAVNAVPGATVGSLAATVNSAIGGVRNAYTALNTAVGCGG